MTTRAKDRLIDIGGAVVFFILPGLLAVTVFLGGNDSPGVGYPYRVDRQFHRLCRERSLGSATFCTCVISRLEQNLEYEDFRREDISILLGKPSPEIAAAIKPCEKRRQTAPDG